MHPLLAQQLVAHFSPAGLPPAAAAFVRAVDAAYAEFERRAAAPPPPPATAAPANGGTEAEVRAVIEALPDVILRLDAEGNIVPLKAPDHAADPQAHRFNKRRISSRLADLPHAEVRAAFQQGLAAVLADGRQHEFGYSLPAEDGEKFFGVRLVAFQPAGAIAVIQDVTARKRAEAEREQLHRELVAASRHAGMAEIATGVLHNVGNVLNSVNIAADVLVDRLQKSKLPSLGRAVALLRARTAESGAAPDPAAVQLAEFFAALAEQLGREQAALLEEAQGLRKNLDHIKQIVAMQQAYARVSGAHEPLALAELADDALRLTASTLAVRHIEIVRAYEPVPTVLADRHAVIQILVNLVNNAAQALEARTAGRRLVLRVGPAPAGRVRVEVADNGAGIAAANLARIFHHGFTTKKSGHGFGLHSGANAAKEMGGRLSAHSAGPGCGAEFVLELPVRPAVPRAAAA